MTNTASMQRLNSLPLIKAVEIAYKNIRMRLSRSLLVTSGIVLALAFLISILASEAMIRGMRQWSQSAELSQRFVALRAQRQAIEAKLKPIEAELHTASR